MELKIRKCVTGAMLLAAVCNTAGVAYAADPASVEQVYVNLPEVDVYGTGIDTNGLSAYLGSKDLKVEKTGTFAETQEPIYYYVLLDVSNSMPDAYFNGIRQAIAGFEATLGPNDRMILYTFGEQVDMVLDENHSRDMTQSVLNGLANKDNKTLLFDAVNQAADRADQVKAETCQRRILIVISDGEDFTVGGTGVQETQDNLRQKGLPVYAFAISDTARTNINSFGEFARTTGGQMTVFDAAQAPTVLSTFHQERMADQCVELKAENNVISNQMESLTLKTGDSQNIVKDVMVNRYMPDNQAPTLEEVELTDEGKLKILFSEPVQGADSTVNYVVTCDDKQETVTAVNTSTDDSNTLILSFADELQPGTYTLSCANITDVSMEKNAVSNTAEFEVDQLPIAKRILNLAKKWYGAVLAAAVLALAGVILFIYRRVKRGHGVLYVDGKPVMASDVEVHRHVEIQDEEGMPFQVKIRVKGGKPEDLDLKITDSFIVGRAQICNLYFDDKRMSRQHFALEWDGQNMYVTDLDTTNGTLVNDVKISKRRMLNQGDKITAGSVDMTIRW